MNQPKTEPQADADLRHDPSPRPPSRPLAKALMVLCGLLLLSSSGILSPTSAQGAACLAAASICPATPSPPDPAQSVACATDAVATLADDGLDALARQDANATAYAAGDALAKAASCCPCPPPCAQSIVSDAGTVWTHYNQYNANEGFRQASVPVAANSLWSTGIQQAQWTTGLPVPQFIWSYAGGNPASHNPTRLPVMFEREFPSCIYHSSGVGESGVTLSIVADDSFLVVFNGQVLSPAAPPCNGQAFNSPDDQSCFSVVHSVALPPLVNAGSGAPNNKLVIYVWNHENGVSPNPGMLRYRLDY